MAANQTLKRNIFGSLVILAIMMACTGSLFCTNAFAQTGHDSDSVTPAAHTDKGTAKYGLIAAAIAFGFGALGAGIAIAYVGAAAMGAVAEKPEIAGQALIFVALAEGIVVFGFITALMILGKV